MRRTFLQIMRDVYDARRRGVSAAVAIMAACGSDDDWNMIFEVLVRSARLESRLKKFRPRHG